MVKTSIICDICQKDCSEDPYGISFGSMLKPAEHIHVNLCKEHMDESVKAISMAVLGPASEDFDSPEESNGEAS